MTGYYLNRHISQYGAGWKPITRTSGCTWTSGANGIDAQSGGKRTATPDEVHAKVKRTEETSPATPGWSLPDLDLAMARMGIGFETRIGAGWTALRKLHDTGHYIVLQGDSEVFSDATCSGTFDGDHCIGVHPAEDGGRWRIDDPICAAARYESEAVLQRYAERLAPSTRFGYFTTPVPLEVPDTSTEDVMRSFAVPERPSVAIVKAGTRLYADSAWKTVKVTVGKTTTVRYIGWDRPNYHVVGWDQSPQVKGKSALYAKWTDVSAITESIPDSALV